MSESTDKSELAIDRANSITTLSDLFILYALDRLGGEETPRAISSLLRHFGIFISVRAIERRLEEADKLYSGGDQGKLANKSDEARIQIRFLERAFRGLVTNATTKPPRGAFSYGGEQFVRCEWTPSGFSAKFLDPGDSDLEEAERARIKVCKTT